MKPVPNLRAALAESKDGLKVFLIEPFVQFFQQFTQNAPNAVSISVGSSPFQYTPNEIGNAIVSGGTVSSVQLIRGSDTITIATSTANPVVVPLSVGDILKITYTVVPTIKFLGT